MNQGTLTKLFFDAVERHAGRPAAYRAKIGGEWKPLTHREVEARVRNASLGLRELEKPAHNANEENQHRQAAAPRFNEAARWFGVARDWFAGKTGEEWNAK